MILAPCQTSFDYMMRVYFWTFYSVPFVYMPVVMAVPHCSGYSGSLISFETGKFETSNLALCFQYWKKTKQNKTKKTIGYSGTLGF
jgi:hypothetical protein